MLLGNGGCCYRYYKRSGAEHSEVEVEYNKKLQSMQHAAEDQEKQHTSLLDQV